MKKLLDSKDTEPEFLTWGRLIDESGPNSHGIHTAHGIDDLTDYLLDLITGFWRNHGLDNQGTRGSISVEADQESVSVFRFRRRMMRRPEISATNAMVK